MSRIKGALNTKLQAVVEERFLSLFSILTAGTEAEFVNASAMPCETSLSGGLKD